MSNPKTAKQFNQEMGIGEAWMSEAKFIPRALTQSQPNLNNKGVSVQNERDTDIVGIKFLNEQASVVQELTMNVETAKALKKALNTMKVLDD